MRRISLSKKRHEAARFIRERLLRLQNYSQITERIDLFSTPITNEGIGAIYILSPQVFERLIPSSAPVGVVFIDGSFLVIKEIFQYAYASEDADEPSICHLEYSFHLTPGPSPSTERGACVRRKIRFSAMISTLILAI
jgi:hypothetical protein